MTGDVESVLQSSGGYKHSRKQSRLKKMELLRNSHGVDVYWVEVSFLTCSRHASEGRGLGM
jgi:hypothetical protein